MPFVSVTAEGVPRFGVTSVGLVAKTSAPVPVSSDSEFMSAREFAVVVSAPPVVVKTPRSAVKPLKVMVPDEVRPVRELSVPVMFEFPVTVMPPEETVSVVGVVMAPALLIVVVAVPPIAAVYAESAVVDAFITVNRSVASS